MSKKRNLISLLLCVVLAACNKTGASQAAVAQYTISYAGSAVTVRADGEYVGTTRDALEFSCVKNEYEGAQLLISAETEVTDIELTAGDLTCGSDVLQKENFSVYGENCFAITEPENADSPYPPGIYPDGLIPMSYWKAAGENKIPAGQTRGLWVTVYVPKETKAGLYTGSFTLTAGGKTQAVPVRVQVYDYTLTDEVTMQTLFLLRSDFTFTYGELDSTLDMMRAYYDFLLEYRLNAYNIPIESVSDVTQFVDSVKEYYDNPKVSTYGLPSSSKGNGSVFYPTVAKAQVLALAEASTAGKNYLSKLVVKNGDETDYIATLSGYESTYRTDINNNKKILLAFDAAAAEILADREKYANYIANFDSAEAAAQAVREIPIVDPLCYAATYLTARADNPAYPTTFEGELLTTTKIWCPKTEAVESEYLTAVQEAADKYGAQLWWYTANIPTWPQPTYHIDTNPLSARVMSWMQRAYGITGNLYWAVTSVDAGDDVYSEAAWPAGDGCLVYPGAKYGHYGPLPSMRLERMRDGMEEYELLGALEEKLTAYAASKGTAFDGRSVLNTLYERLFTGAQAYDDPETFTAVRETLLKMLSDDPAENLFLTDVDVRGEKAVVTCYSEKPFTTALPCTQTGNLYTVEIPLTEKEAYLTGQIEGKEISVFVARGREKYAIADAARVTLSDGSTAVSESGRLRLRLAGKYTGTAADYLFTPSADVPLTADGAAIDLTATKLLTLTVTNESPREVTAYVYLRAGTAKRLVKEVKLARNSTVPIVIRTDIETWSRLNAVTSFAIETANETDADNNPYTAELSVSAVEVTL